MPCQIQDKLGYMAPDGTFVPLASQQIYAVPGSPTYRVSYSGTYRPLLGQNPNISSAAFKYGVLSQTDGTGQYSFTLPYASTETNPAAPTAQWTLVYPDGSQLTGAVPAVAGPVAVDDLLTTYSWAWASQVYVAPVTAGSFAKGTISFTPGSASASIVFLTTFTANSYQVTLTPAVDAVDGTIPRVGTTAKTKTGFQVVLDTTGYTGQVDWTAQL